MAFLVFLFVVVETKQIIPLGRLAYFLGLGHFVFLAVGHDTCRYIETWDRKHLRLVLWRFSSFNCFLKVFPLYQP